MVLNDGQTATCRVKVVCTTVDLPAKAKVLNFTQYNGRYGCTVCKQEGVVVNVGRGSTRVYQYTDPLAQLRSHRECFEFGKMALVQDEVRTLYVIISVTIKHYMHACILYTHLIYIHVHHLVCTIHMQSQYGVKGLSALHILPSYDIVNGTVIDYMHCVLEGVGKKLMNMWFSVAGQPCYIKRHVSTVNTRLLGIKPPNTITRTPREVDQASKWKGIHTCTCTIKSMMCL